MSTRLRAAAALLMLACASDGGAPDAAEKIRASDEIAAPCFAIPETRAYLTAVREKVIATWKLPRYASADSSVSLRFQFGARGELVLLRMLEASNQSIGESAMQAMRDSEPFGALPDEAACLLNLPVTATFSNPESPR